MDIRVVKKPLVTNSPPKRLFTFTRLCFIALPLLFLILSSPILYFMTLITSLTNSSVMSLPLFICSSIITLLACIIGAVGYRTVPQVSKFLFLLGGVIFLLSIILIDTKEDSKPLIECQTLRNNPFCYESKEGFDCPGGVYTFENFMIGPCPFIEDSVRYAQNLDKFRNLPEGDTELVKSFSFNMVDHAKTRFEDIVIEIRNSDNPKSLNFEKDLMSINNCYNSIYGGDSSTGTLLTSKLLDDRIINETHLNKYYEYLEAHGRSGKKDMPFSALPSGPPELGCDTIPISSWGIPDKY